ncbi:MAG: T9SS type A sorting domain-containing protein [Candidatus Eisenbacteria bacterium]|nr:T9SS type A sorting domain-containing protein [Candidatus Eisenbacteria bacterium]
MRTLRTALAAAATLAAVVISASSFEITQSVVGSGASVAGGGSCEVLGTVGQPAIGHTAGGSYEHGVGFWYQPGWILTGVPDDGFPSMFRLEQNSPNPFNPVTAVRFAMPKKARACIRVYDVGGRLVRVLLDEEREPGHHEITFDARGLPSGVYFMRMEASGFSDTRKLVLLK